MEVKAGYKLTEVGVIPEDWEVKPLKGKVSIAHGFAFASEHFASSGEFRLTTPGHFYEEGGFRDLDEKQKFYTGEVPSDYVLQPGDLIVAMTEQADGLLGSAAFIPDAVGYLHNQRLGRVRTLSSEIELGYVFWLFNSTTYRARVRETAAGTKVKHTSPEKLLEIFVALPPLPEQRAIAEALSDVDALLAALDRLIAKKRDLKQATMQQLLTGQTRLPGFTGEWEVKRLGDVADVTAGGTPNRANATYWNGDIPWITTSEVDFYTITCANQFITEEGLKNSATKFLPKGTLLMALYGQGKTRGKVGILGIEATTNQACAAILLKPNVSHKFVFYYLSSQYDAIRNLSNTGNQENLNSRLVRAIPLSLPPTTVEQTAIAAVLSDMDAELAALEQRRAKTGLLKQAMMQELLTGRTRLVGNAAPPQPSRSAETFGELSRAAHVEAKREGAVVGDFTSSAPWGES